MSDLVIPVKWKCVICGEEYAIGRDGHKCPPGRERRFNAGKKGAESRMERDGSLEHGPRYGSMLIIGFQMINGENI